MAWSNPNTGYVAGNVPNAAELNLRNDDLNHLLARPYSEVLYTGSNITTASTTYVALTGISTTLTTDGTNAGNRGPLFAYFMGTFRHNTNAGVISLQITIDNISGSGPNPTVVEYTFDNANDTIPIVMMMYVPFGFCLTGSHNIVVNWKTNAGTATLLGTFRTHLFVQEGLN